MEKKQYISTQGEKATYVGGQAVIEGVMMRGRSMYALAVRGPDGNIIVEETDLKTDKAAFFKLPIIRGVVSFVDSLVLGMKLITRSAELAGFDEAEEEPSKFEKFLLEKVGDKKLNDIIMGISVVVAIAFSVGLFMVAPVFVGNLFGSIDIISQNSWALSIIEGVARLLIFIIYISIISKNKDIHRVYQYHGAEHKTINCLEHGEELTVENVSKYSRFHRRCGTSFLLFVMLISMIFFLFVRTNDPVMRIVSRIAFVPLIAGISYEVLRWAGKSRSKFVEIISYPGFKLQGMTTKEPDAEHIECAIASMNAVIAKELAPKENA